MLIFLFVTYWFILFPLICCLCNKSVQWSLGIWLVLLYWNSNTSPAEHQCCVYRSQAFVVLGTSLAIQVAHENICVLLNSVPLQYVLLKLFCFCITCSSFISNPQLKRKLEDVLGHKNTVIKSLQADLSKVSKAHNDLINVYEARLAEYGIPPEDLGFRPLLTKTGANPAGLVVSTWYVCINRSVCHNLHALTYGQCTVCLIVILWLP